MFLNDNEIRILRNKIKTPLTTNNFKELKDLMKTTDAYTLEYPCTLLNTVGQFGQKGSFETKRL